MPSICPIFRRPVENGPFQPRPPKWACPQPVPRRARSHRWSCRVCPRNAKKSRCQLPRSPAFKQYRAASRGPIHRLLPHLVQVHPLRHLVQASSSSLCLTNSISSPWRLGALVLPGCPQWPRAAQPICPPHQRLTCRLYLRHTCPVPPREDCLPHHQLACPLLRRVGYPRRAGP